LALLRARLSLALGGFILRLRSWARALFPSGWRRRPPHDQELPDVLDWRGLELRADPREHRLARIAVIVEHAHFDQLVREQIDIDLV